MQSLLSATAIVCVRNICACYNTNVVHLPFLFCRDCNSFFEWCFISAKPVQISHNAPRKCTMTYAECIGAMQCMDNVPSTRREYAAWRKTLFKTGVKHALPARPDVKFATCGWCCWRHFLSCSELHNASCESYSNEREYAVLKDQVRRARVACFKEYRKMRRDNPKTFWPEKPQIKFRRHGWCCQGHFFGSVSRTAPCKRRTTVAAYKTVQALAKAAHVTSRETYRVWHQSLSDVCVPVNPREAYKGEWCCWTCFVSDTESCAQSYFVNLN